MAQKPFISLLLPRLMDQGGIFLSHTLFTSGGHYPGYIDGTISLKQQSIQSNILSMLTPRLQRHHFKAWRHQHFSTTIGMNGNQHGFE